MNDTPFFHANRGKGRPQILLIGNGLERGDGQPEWSALIDALRAPGREPITKEEKERIPFPLLYQLESTPKPAPSVLGADDVKAEEQRLAEGLKCLKHSANPLLARLPAVGADHFFTTNYPYSLEAAFFPKRDFQKPHSRSAVRFSLVPPDRDGKQHREQHYRLHTGYEAKNLDGSRVGLWHIHGETGVPKGIVVGHDRYGRLLSRMEQLCGKEIARTGDDSPRPFLSWPDLFLFGDVYVLGMGFAPCEYDLWWLLRRKQRERYADGKVYFFGNSSGDDSSLRERLLEAHGVQINPFGVKKQVDYTAFYNMALDAITEHIREQKA